MAGKCPALENGRCLYRKFQPAGRMRSIVGNRSELPFVPHSGAYGSCRNSRAARLPGRGRPLSHRHCRIMSRRPSELSQGSLLPEKRTGGSCLRRREAPQGRRLDLARTQAAQASLGSWATRSIQCRGPGAKAVQSCRSGPGILQSCKKFMPPDDLPEIPGPKDCKPSRVSRPEIPSST